MNDVWGFLRGARRDSGAVGMPDGRSAKPDREKITGEYGALTGLYESVLQRIVADVRDALSARGLNAAVKYRVKDPQSYFGKLVRRMKDARGAGAGITDILGIRIVCPFLEDLEKAEKVILEGFEVAEYEKKGTQHSFREFGYDSVHLMLRVGKYLPAERKGLCDLCEVQLSTILQDAWSEVEHELVYKSGFTPFDIPLKRKLAALNANLTLADIIFQEIRDYHRGIHSQMKRRRDALFHSITLPGEDDDGSYNIAAEDRGREAGGKAAVEAMPDDSIDNVLLKAISAHNIGEYRLSIDLYDRVLSQEGLADEVRSVLFNHRGMAWLAQGMYAEAISDFSESVLSDPRNFRAYNNRGICRRMTGDHGAALEDLGRSLEINPYHADTYYTRALVYYDLGDPVRSLEDCEKVINFKPDSEMAKRFAGLLRKKLFQE